KMQWILPRGCCICGGCAEKAQKKQGGPGVMAGASGGDRAARGPPPRHTPPRRAHDTARAPRPTREARDSTAAPPVGGQAAGRAARTPPPRPAAPAAGAMAAGAAAEPLPLPVTPTPPAPGEKSLADTPVAVDAGANQGYDAPRHQWRFALEAGADFLNRDLS